MPDKMLPEWEANKPVSAEHLNRMQEYVARGNTPDSIETSSGTAVRKIQPVQIRFMKLAEVMGEGMEITADAQSSENVTRDRQGTPLAYNRQSRDFDALKAEPYGNLVDALDGIYDRESIIPCVSENGKWIPLYTYSVYHALTCKDDDGSYPPESEEPNVYPVRYVRLVYTELGGQQTITRENLKEGEGPEGPDGYVANIYEGTEPHYIPEETLIWFYRVPGPVGPQNFTQLCCEFDDKSSSSVSTSESSKSSSSLSSNSSSNSSSQSFSESSPSSQSASSPSSQSASSASSSQSGSESSASPSSVSTSSVSPLSDSSVSTSAVSESSLDERQITVVTALTFDDETCELGYMTRTITFPVDSGVIIGGEVDN